MARLTGGRGPSDRDWAVFEARDPAAPWIYGVLSTGIFCRAACPARLPLRRNLRLFETGAQAVEAGFRACKRCKPPQD